MEHKLAVTDLYLTLGQPHYFIREYQQRFDWHGKPHLIKPDAVAMLPDDSIAFFEVQRTPTESNKWSGKRRGYERYFATGAWVDTFPVKPCLCIVQYANQQLDTIGPGLGYDLTVLNGIEEVRGLGHLKHDWEVSRQETREDVYAGRSTDLR